MSNQGERKTDITLGPGESDVVDETFMVALLAPYLKASLLASSSRFVFDAPNTLLGFIPLGSRKNSIPIRNIASVSVDTKFRFGRFALAVILLSIGLANFGNSPILAVVLLLLSIPFFIMSFPSELKVTNNSGMSESVSVSALEKAKLKVFEASLQSRVFADADALRREQAEQHHLQQQMLQQLSLQQQIATNQNLAAMAQGQAAMNAGMSNPQAGQFNAGMPNAQPGQFSVGMPNPQSGQFNGGAPNGQQNQS